MKLKDNLYTLTDYAKAENGGSFTLSPIKECLIYKAHFPEQPITPGVCIMQMAVELAGELLQKRLTLVKVKNVKFLSVINPDETDVFMYDIANVKTNETEVSFQAVAKSETSVFAKMSLTCKVG